MQTALLLWVYPRHLGGIIFLPWQAAQQRFEADFVAAATGE
jgi:hypothetical protein